MVGPIYLENHSPLLSFLHALPDLPVPGELALSLPALPVPGIVPGSLPVLSLSNGSNGSKVAPCSLVPLPKNAVFAPKKSVIGPRLDLFSTTFLILSTS